LSSAVLAVGGEVLARPVKHWHLSGDTPDPPDARRAMRVERAACSICGHLGAMADAAFCADCGLLILPECFGGYCDTCCQPRCIHCAAHAGEAACATCELPFAESPYSA
jgi:LRP1 type putative zinc finger protein